MEQGKDIKKLTNQIFQKRGFPPVKNFAQEFADGIKFQQLFNILYDEDIDCKLEKSNLVETRRINWNKINVTICFNYLQQQFYLVTPSMKALAKGNNEEVVLKVIMNLINTTQGVKFDLIIQNQYETFLDDEAIRDIADIVQSDSQYYDNPESASSSGKSAKYSKRSDQFAYLEKQ